MSSYKGKNFRYKPQSRDSSAHEGGGGRGESSRGSMDFTPFLNDISAVNMERYLDAVHQYALESQEHSIVASWLRGRIPQVMLEYDQPRSKQNLLGLQAKHHTVSDGSVSTASLTADEVRQLLIKKVVNDDRNRRELAKDTKGETGGSSMDANSSSSGSKMSSKVSLAKDTTGKTGGSSMDASSSSSGSKTESNAESSRKDSNVEQVETEEEIAEALKSIFPSNGKKSREIERSKIVQAATTLLSKMVYVWPSRDVRTKMLASKPLCDAFDNSDVIRFIEELKIFALAGTGNSETNREVAEAHLTKLRMKPGKSLEYFTEFTEAVEHVKVCKSSFSEFKIVDLFFRNIDQESFPAWYVKFLSKDEPMYRFQKLRFEEAKEYALEYHNNVIRVNERSATKGKESDNNKPGFVKHLRQLKPAIAESAATKAPITIDAVVLATLMKQATAGVTAGKKKRKVGWEQEGKEGENNDGANKKIKKDNNAIERKICFSFRDKGKCDFGSNCYFAHSK